MRDFPMPGSPETSTSWPSPALARAQRSKSRSISSSRPTSGVIAGPRSASKRLSTGLFPSTCQLRIGSVLPAASIAPSSRQSNRSPVRRRVAGSIVTVPGCVDTASREARFGASPTMPSPRAAPTPTGSPTMTMPVAMPIRHRTGASASDPRLPTIAHNSRPARIACSASSSCASG